MPHMSSITLLGLAAALSGGTTLLGQQGKLDDVVSSAPAQTNDVRLASVVVDGETLFSVRGVTARPADRRAREIADRIRALAANPSVRPDLLTLEDHPGATWIMANGQRIMALLDEDAAIEETARHPLAELYRVRIGEAIEEWRHSRQSVVLWGHALYTLGATVAFLIAGWFGRKLFVRLRSIVERYYQARMQRIQDRAFQLLRADQIWRAVTGILNLLWGTAVAVTVYFYLNYVLALFPWSRGVAKILFDVAMNPVRTIGLGLIGFIPNFVFLTILVLVTRYLLKIMRLFFEGVGAATIQLKGFDPEWALPTLRLVRLLFILFAVVVAYPYIPGSSSEAFKGVSLFMGIIFSLGSSSLIGNFVAGYSMTYRRAFRIGDRVKIGEHIGEVLRMRLLVTHLRTLKNEEVVVPNSTILGSEVVNYSSMSGARGLILHTTVGIGYETPWRQVEAMLLEAAARTPGLRAQPSPFVLQKELGDYCVTYEINVFSDTADTMEPLYTQLHRNILDLFNEYGVQIMTPSYESDPGEPKVVPKEQWYAAPAMPPQSAELPKAVLSSR
jgi:small-conductance mechanosensitive channel